jgi:hypothetical protein
LTGLKKSGNLGPVSTQEIIAELPKLNRSELEQVNLKLSELLFHAGGFPRSWSAAETIRRGGSRFALGLFWQAILIHNFPVVIPPQFVL